MGAYLRNTDAAKHRTDLYEDHGRVDMYSQLLPAIRMTEILRKFDIWSRKSQFSGTAGLDGRKLATSMLLLPGACFT
jgi:hypothetical protein